MGTQQILVVDDDKSITKIVKAYLEQAGYRVLVAFDGESAMHTLLSEKPDLLILDLMLPDRDGWDITNSIRNDKRLAATPIIMPVSYTHLTLPTRCHRCRSRWSADH